MPTATAPRAIIVAAGMGSRLAPYTDDRPKCLVEVNGKSILQRQLEAYRAAGVDEVCVVRGYRGGQIDLPGLRYFENVAYRQNNILASLFFAEPAMEDGFYFSYSDIVFRPEAVAKLATADGDYALVVDRRWDEAYVGRDLHPVSEAELCAVTDGRVQAVGKRVVPREQAHGEFIGLARFSARAAQTMRREYRRLEAELGPERPFGNAARFASAYLTDLLNHLIAQGETLRPVDIEGGWREIDTTQDLERARALVDW
jgi:choline kinase